MEIAGAKILVVDDEPNIREVVGRYLKKEGYEISSAADGEEALQLYRQGHPDLVVLDLMLPKLSGQEVCRRIQAEGRVPTIMLTAKTAEEDRIIGLGLGADDYVVKPFSPRELVARVEAVLRRANDARSNSTDYEVLEFGGLRIDPGRRGVSVANVPVELTVREFDLLHYLASDPGRVYGREHLMKSVWGYAFPGETSTVTVHVRRLREKIEPDPAHPRYLQTVWGVGYRFNGE